MQTNAEKLISEPEKKKLMYQMEIFAGKSILTTIDVMATSDEEAIRLTAESLKINIRKRYAPK